MFADIKRSVLVVEDDETLQAALKYNLSNEGFQVISATDGEIAVEVARRYRPDLIILDLMIPRLDGLEVCRLLRKDMSAPILMLTARDSELDKVVGLDMGADDYMTKPFSMRELMARVRAMSRRVQTASKTDASAGMLSAGDLVLNVRAKSANFKGNKLDLSPKEYELLAFLVSNPGMAFSRNELLDNVWGDDFFGDHRTVDVHIRRLRSKIESGSGSPRRIITIRGTGYRFEL